MVDCLQAGLTWRRSCLHLAGDRRAVRSKVSCCLLPAAATSEEGSTARHSDPTTSLGGSPSLSEGKPRKQWSTLPGPHLLA